MRKFILMLAFAAASPAATADPVAGIWKTEVNGEGGYLEVTISPCESDADRTCGKISKAVSDGKVDADYQYLNKLMVWDMKTRDGSAYSDGKIWDPETDKTYKSKMKLTNDVLDVEGCVAFICRGQNWTRVQQEATD